MTSYYISHRDHPFHAEPRPLLFDTEWQEWENGVRLIWEDLIDPAASLEISAVRPDPPRFAFRGTCATVIVHQHGNPARAACLIIAVHIMDPHTRFDEGAHSAELTSTVSCTDCDHGQS